MRIAIGIEYDGSGFLGWQSQRGGGTLQDALESALAAIAAAPVRVIASGRTDTGVHATLQVVHFDCAHERPMSAWVRGVNAHLPATVAVRWAIAVDSAFHARFSATGRGYTYVLLNRAPRPGLLAARAGWFHRPLDVERMRQAAERLVGRHDFSAFRSSQCQAKSPVRTLRAMSIERRGDLLLFDVRADAFLHHMVRNLVGALVYVGKGRYPPEWTTELLAAGDRRRAAPTFGAAGLYLTSVDYEAHWGIPESRVEVPIAGNRSPAADFSTVADGA